MEAFRDLSTCRPPEGPIPWTAAALYAEKKALEPDTTDLLWSIVRTMDVAERRWEVENTMRPASKEKGKKGDA